MDSQRQSCQAPKCCVENSDLVTAAGDGDLEKVRALRERISKQIIFSVFLRQKLQVTFYMFRLSTLFLSILQKGEEHAEVYRPELEESEQRTHNLRSA